MNQMQEIYTNRIRKEIGGGFKVCCKKKVLRMYIEYASVYNYMKQQRYLIRRKIEKKWFENPYIWDKANS